MTRSITRVAPSLTVVLLSWSFALGDRLVKWGRLTSAGWAKPMHQSPGPPPGRDWSACGARHYNCWWTGPSVTNLGYRADVVAPRLLQCCGHGGQRDGRRTASTACTGAHGGAVASRHRHLPVDRHRRLAADVGA